MNQEIKKQWVEALRSGNYKQDKGHLRTKFGFCCLGVLCDILKDKLKTEWSVDGTFCFKGCSTILPTSVMELTQLHSENPKVEGETLADFNDGNENRMVSPKTFPEIADLIEKHL